MQIVEMTFGSALYGTKTPSSDLDIKAVHIPSATDILLQRVKPVVSRKTKADNSAKNTADDIDFESYSLQKYLGLVAEGQTVALDMLFAPDWAIISRTPYWTEIQKNRDRLLSRGYASFLGYCRAQANKYGIKGSRMAAARAAVNLLEVGMNVLGTSAKLAQFDSELSWLCLEQDHSSIDSIPDAAGNKILHLNVCGRKAPYTSSIKNAYEIYRVLFDEYGKRATAAEKNEGIDWKALSHAVRIGHQAIELLTAKFVTFPRPEAEHLRAIKAGEMPYSQVSEEIEALLERIEATALTSPLPERPDREWIDDFVIACHREEIADGDF